MSAPRNLTALPTNRARLSQPQQSSFAPKRPSQPSLRLGQSRAGLRG